MRLEQLLDKRQVTELKKLCEQKQKYEIASSLAISKLVNSFTLYFEAGLDRLKSTVCEDCINNCSFNKQMRYIKNCSCTHKIVQL